MALLIDGVVQSVRVGEGQLGFGYWSAMLPDASPRTALILGLGGGTLAALLRRRFGRVAITGVEKDLAVLELARRAFSEQLEGVQVVVGDAFAFVAETSGAFDYVAVDLFEDQRVPREVFSRPFLRRLRAMTEPGGLVAINYFQDRRAAHRRRRLERSFPRVELRPCGKNIVARCRVR